MATTSTPRKIISQSTAITSESSNLSSFGSASM
uniref:CYP78D3v1 n=1 Tax=Arundo donax TaxID=35708 RepID=A0A0A8YP01_ARUDO